MKAHAMFDDISELERNTLIVSVVPSKPYGWRVRIGSGSNARSFTARDSALTYARILAQENPPSLLVLFDSDGLVTSQWAFPQQSAKRA
jgi:hypothetical protein